jgi:hypothetical protein
MVIIATSGNAEVCRCLAFVPAGRFRAITAGEFLWFRVRHFAMIRESLIG